MKGFKNTTRTQYSMGGDVYAKGGMAKGAAKISKVMGEFKKGELHSGSKDGPKVTKPAQAKAIAMSEARKAGMKAPMKKNEGGKVGKMPPLGETMKSVRRLPPEPTPEHMRALEDRFAEKKRPSLGDTMKSVRRLPKELTPEQMRDLEEGSKVRKYAEGGAVEPMMQPPMKAPMLVPPQAFQDLMRNMPVQPVRGTTPDFEMQPLIDMVETRKQLPMVEPPLMMERPTRPPMQKIYEPRRPPGASSTSKLIEQGLQRIQQKQRPGMDPVDPGFAIDRGGYGMTAPPAGMAPVDPNKAMMMKHGGRTAMPKGKR